MSEADVQAAEPDDTAQQPEPVEAKAQRMGWRPKDEFKGDESRWIDAATFVQRGEDILPIVQANNKALEKALAESQKQIKSLERTFRDFGVHHTKTVQAQYDRALADLQSKQADAAAIGDVQTVRQTTDAIVELGKEVRAEPANGPDKAEMQRVRSQFKADNPWFETDVVMTAAASAIGDELAAKGVTDPETQAAEIAKRIKAEFPHKFENPNRRLPSAVEGSGTARRTGGKSYSDLPPEAKAACDRFVKQGLLTQQQYAKDYDWGTK